MMRVVRVPRRREEQLRAHSRQYDQLVAQRKGISAQGRSLTLSQGFRSMADGWWRRKAYQQWSKLLPEWMPEPIGSFRPSLQLLDQQIAQRKKELIQSNDQVLPKGFGAQTLVQMDREIGEWSRFSNRRKVACFFGFVPREYSTGSTQRLGSITKVGSARLRAKSIELVWRLPSFSTQLRTHLTVAPNLRVTALTKCSRKRPRWQWLEEWSSISGACALDVRAPRTWTGSQPKSTTQKIAL